MSWEQEKKEIATIKKIMAWADETSPVSYRRSWWLAKAAPMRPSLTARGVAQTLEAWAVTVAPACDAQGNPYPPYFEGEYIGWVAGVTAPSEATIAEMVAKWEAAESEEPEAAEEAAEPAESAESEEPEAAEEAAEPAESEEPEAAEEAAESAEPEEPEAAEEAAESAEPEELEASATRQLLLARVAHDAAVRELETLAPTAEFEAVEALRMKARNARRKIQRANQILAAFKAARVERARSFFWRGRMALSSYKEESLTARIAAAREAVANTATRLSREAREASRREERAEKDWLSTVEYLCKSTRNVPELLFSVREKWASFEQSCAAQKWIVARSAFLHAEEEAQTTRRKAWMYQQILSAQY